MIQLTRDIVLQSMSPTPWDFSNQLLYKLCEQYPDHTDTGEVLAKILLIGRVYAAAIERRKNKPDDDQNDDFYIHTVAPAIKTSQIDEWLHNARSVKPGKMDSFTTLVSVHSNVTELFNMISGLDKRSLASKYLHFHVPKLFFIFDSRAVKAMRAFSHLLPRATRTEGIGDNEYRKFAEKCRHLIVFCQTSFGLNLRPRHIDNLLLAAHASET